MLRDKSQCPTHTRIPWGARDHQYNYRLRYFIIGLLLITFTSVIIVGVVFMFIQRDGTRDKFKSELALGYDEAIGTTMMMCPTNGPRGVEDENTCHRPFLGGYVRF
ncbi:hypothetical protein RJ55_03914 [Drechmeria coniospora]|nr:hypothetical protein RJ55_03914 [Drechmeria coniospora]